MQKQVDKSHYEFAKYVTKHRWASMWHQLDEVLKLKPKRVLEVGPGPGVFKAMAGLFGVHVETLDIDPELKPDHLASVFDMPFEDGSFDVVCAFQMLEHLPFEESLKAFAEMSRVASRYVLISLPDAEIMWRYVIYLPKLGERHFLVPRPLQRLKHHQFDGEHYWELNKLGFEREKVIQAFEGVGSMRRERSFRVMENPYHQFLLFAKELDPVKAD